VEETGAFHIDGININGNIISGDAEFTDNGLLLNGELEMTLKSAVLFAGPSTWGSALKNGLSSTN